MKYGVVPEFEGEYHFLSNFHMAPFKWRNEVFPSGEHAFAFAKSFCAMTSLVATWGPDAVLAAKTPGEAKRVGHQMEIHVDQWDANKVQWMREIVHAKFKQNLSDEDMVGQLINTGAMMLVEGNTWNDTFWGRCNGKGYNTLGVLLMEERGYWLKGAL